MKNHMSKTQLSKTLMPQIGDVLSGRYKIVYVNYAQFRVTCKCKTYPEIGGILEIDDKLFKVNYFNFSNDTFTAEFVGIKENELPPVETIQDKTLTRLIDD